MSESERPSASEIVSAAAETGGNLASVVLAGLFGPDGTVAGALLGPSFTLALKHAIGQISRWVGDRQVERVSETIRAAAADIEQYRAGGGEVVGMFASVGDERSDAEEVAEGILQTAAFAYEQRKAPYLGHLLASIAIRGDIHLADAHRLTRLVGELSYRQLACLAAIGSGEAKIDTIQAGVAMAYTKQNQMSAGIAEEVEELSNEHDLIGNRDSTREGDIATDSGLTLGHRSLPRDLALTERGRFLYGLLRLDTLPVDDQQIVVMELMGES